MNDRRSVAVVLKRSYLLLVLAVALSAAFYAASVFALRIKPANQQLSARTTDHFTEGMGWYPGEPLVSTQPVRAWGSWCGDDNHTGSLVIGPFPAAGEVRIAVGGYPTKSGNQLYVEHVATRKRLDLKSGNIGERWDIVSRALPAEWRGQPVTLHAIDNAKGHAGWLAVTEPIVGGSGASAARTFRALALMAPILLLLWHKPHPSRIGPQTVLARVERLAPWFAGAVALVPFIWCVSSFADVWWFGDEWDQLDQIARMGFWRWTVHPFGENVVPLFKAMWGGLALSSGGVYLPMLAAVWLTHALNTALLARLLRRVGFDWPGTLAGCATFGLAAANVEVLAWSIQWSNVLAVLFLLIGLDRVLHHPPRPGARDWRTNIVLVACAAASAAAFVRGVLTGIVLAIGVLSPDDDPRRGWTRWRSAVLCVAPSAAVMVWIFLSATGNHNNLREEGLWLKAAEFAAWFWAAVPLHRLLEVATWDTRTTHLLAFAKFMIILAALCRSRGNMRRLLALVCLFDLGNAALLGIGRHQTGLLMVNGSRYYYNSLVCMAPFVAFAFDTWVAAIPGQLARRLVGTMAAATVAFWVMRAWPSEAESFAAGRGRNTRELLLHHPAPSAVGAVPGIPFLMTSRAKELIVIYNLH